MTVQLLVPAAGMGTRLGCSGPKALIDLCGKPLLTHTLSRFAAMGLATNAVVTAPADTVADFQSVVDRHFPDIEIKVIAGGAERQESVYRGLCALMEDTEIVVIHDAARPFVTAESVQASIDAAQTVGAATVAIPTVDTILVSDAEDFLMDTPDRQATWACQTPQTFRVEVIRAAHEAAQSERFLGTDDATLVRRAGHAVKLVHGTRFNLKVTTPEDVALAQYIIEKGLM